MKNWKVITFFTVFIVVLFSIYECKPKGVFEKFDETAYNYAFYKDAYWAAQELARSSASRKIEIEYNYVFHCPSGNLDLEKYWKHYPNDLVYMTNNLDGCWEIYIFMKDHNPDPRFLKISKKWKYPACSPLPVVRNNN